MKKKLLILSFSPIASDARVLKQVRGLSSDFDVTTCGYGDAPAGVAEHLQIPSSTPNRPFGGYLRLHAYSAAYWLMPSVRAAKSAIGKRAFDIVLANDVEAVPLALSLRPHRGVHADLHEYSPLLHEDIPAWRALQTPYLNWLCRRHVSRAASWSTVSRGLAEQYEREFGFRPELVTNAAPFEELSPSSTSERIRLVHSGVGMRDRFLETLVEAVTAAHVDVSLDLYLVPNEPAYVDELRSNVAGNPRVTVHDPVPYADLARTLNGYDVGVHLLPPVNFNNRWALPNKLFDYVQARLGVLIGPSPEMAHYVNEYGIGKVADGFASGDLTVAIDQLTPDRVSAWKAAADANAERLCAESQVQIWRAAIERLAASQPPAS
ncbi:glycosyltransferase family 4 protein [Rarobacter faecitabidus]|uniref:D-inositol 3-phosphate glycosyltransferase n=1 Tax=Rarobacter faecitabidus TaxID=13243 RepID=A0A542ZU50_RARFA|nr:glycosyltransferase family 4 protein [Rarobacter faecitabidus]TQL63881.1 hypothetical protein FB461_0360 [Rarobacter faecitabidus]